MVVSSECGDLWQEGMECLRMILVEDIPVRYEMYASELAKVC